MLKGANVQVSVAAVRVVLGWRSGAGVPDADGSALLLVGGKVRDDNDFVFYNQPSHPAGSVRYEGKQRAGDLVTDTLLVNLGAVEPAVDRILLAASADGGTFGQLPDVHIRLLDAANGAEVARFDSTGATTETAFILGELYRRAGAWKFRAVGQGYASGLAGLARDFGISVDDAPAAPTAPPTPSARQAAPHTPAAPPTPSAPPSAPYVPPSAPPSAPSAPYVPPSAPAAPASPAPVRLTKVTLTKQSPTVSLAKQGGTSGSMRVNLNWTMRGLAARGLFGKRRGAHQPDLDLDLSCLWELTNGKKGIIHALGKNFGSLTKEPYILLDQDDRSGASAEGENLTINLDRGSEFRRILIFADLYQGAESFAGLDAVATLYPQHGAPIEMRLDECDVQSRVAVIALIENVNGELVVHREARYIVNPRNMFRQQAVDLAYNWGLTWQSASK